MTDTEFQYWINGYLMLSEEENLNPEQVKIIQNHAALVQTTVGSANLSALRFSNELQNKIKDKEYILKKTVEEIKNQTF